MGHEMICIMQGGAHEGYFKCLVMGKKKPLLRIKKKRNQQLLQLLGMKKKKGDIVDGINKKKAIAIWDEQGEELLLLGINKIVKTYFSSNVTQGSPTTTY